MESRCSDKKILVIRLSSIGDIIRLVPSMEAVKAAFKEVTFLTEDRFAPILEMYPMAPRVILFPRRELGAAPLFSFLRELRRERFDLVLDMHGILKSAMMTAMARGDEKAGFAKGFGKECSHLFYGTKLVCGESPLISRYDRYRGALKALGLEAGEENAFHPPVIDEASASRVGRFMKDNCLEKEKYVVLFLGASRKQAFKRWPLFRFMELARLIRERTGMKSVLGWGPDEAELCSALNKEQHLVVPPMLSLQESASMILGAAAFVGADTGLMHLSALSGVRTVAVMGATSPVLNKPWGERSRIAFREVVRGSCRGEKCDHSACMGGISAEDVFARISELLDGG